MNKHLQPSKNAALDERLRSHPTIRRSRIFHAHQPTNGYRFKQYALSRATPWLGILFCATAAIWILAYTSPDSPSPEAGNTPAPPPARTKSNGITTRENLPARLVRHAQAQQKFFPTLPNDVLTFLETTDEEEAESIYQKIRLQITAGTTRELIALYDNDPNAEFSHKIIRLISDLQQPASREVAKSILSGDIRAIDDSLFIACAESLATSGESSAIQAILERLEKINADDEGQIPENASGLMNSLQLIASPAMEAFIARAAEGTGTCHGLVARAAAIDALCSFPGYHTTATLTRIGADEKTPAILRERASQLLSDIRSGPFP